MQEGNVKQLFKQMLSSSQKTLEAYSTLKTKITQSPSFLSSIFELLGNQEPSNYHEQKQHFNIVTILHPVLIEIFSQLSSDLQDEVRSGILSAVVTQHTHLPTVSALALLTRQMLEIDGVQPWVESLSELIKWAQSQELSAMLAGIEFFLYLHRQTPQIKSNCDAGLHKLAPILLQKFFAIFANSELGQHNRAKLLCLVLQIIKTFSPLDGIQDNVVKVSFDGTFDLWMSLFVSALQGTLNLNLSIKKYIMKIVVVIYRDMQRYLMLKKYYKPDHIYIIWDFTYRLIPLYLWSFVWNHKVEKYPPQPHTDIKYRDEDSLAYDDESDAICTTIEGLTLASLDFLSILLSIPQLQGALRVSAHHLTNALFHYMLISNQEVVGWKVNPQHFNAQITNLEYESGVRGKCVSILNQMIQKFGDLSIQAILVISQKFLLNIPQNSTISTFTVILNAVLDNDSISQASGGFFESEGKILGLAKISGVDVRSQLEVSGQTWHKVEVGMLVLGRFSEDVIVFQSKQGGSFDIESFVQGIMKQIREEDYYSLLKGQSLYCLTRFIEIISIKYKALFPQLLTASLSCNLPGAPLALRTIACKAASSFLKKIEKHKLQFSNDNLNYILSIEPIERVCEVPLMAETTSVLIEVLIELCKNKELLKISRPPAQYYLALFHQCLTQQSLITSFIGLLQSTIQDYYGFSSLAAVFLSFTGECLKAYHGALNSEQKKFLKSADTELVTTALQVSGVFINKSSQYEQSQPQRQKMIELFAPSVDIMDINEEVPLQIAFSVFLKGILRSCNSLFAESKDLTELVIRLVRLLLRIPKDKSFESGSIYAGNLAILLFDKILGKKHNDILQEIVLKVFRSRTPSVIQSLVLVYARIINQGVSLENKFVLSGQAETRAKEVVDFLSAFSIENRMGLKILVDKWLLQQSLFRGKHTKTATFMALSRLFLLNDKRVDNLLVIGFNPSHTNVNNDVNAPLKIMATLIRCLDNELSGSRGNQDDDEQDEPKMQSRQEGVNVELQKFKEEQEMREQQRVGGSLADRENQQGSTCYMSAMLEFYDDGEECDDKTQQDLIFLNDSSTKFNLGEYLNDFFHYLVENRTEYFKQCVKGLLKSDVKTLEKYVKF